MTGKQRLVGILVLVAVALGVGGGLYLALNIRTIKLSSDLACRVTFGKMSDGEARRVLEAADKQLMPARKYPFARDAYRAVVKYHAGQFRDDALLGVAQTYLAEGKRVRAYPWLVKVVEEYPRGTAIESRRFDRAVAGELGAILAKPPLDYQWGVRYLALLTTAGSADAALWRQRFKDIVETPFTVAASYSHQKELGGVVKETATRDTTASALFYAREQVPALLVQSLRKRADFGAAVPDDKLLAFVENRVAYKSQLERVEKPAAEGAGKESRAQLEKAREEKGLGALPAEWANAFYDAREDTGWVASASVVGELRDVTIAEVLTYAGVDSLTGGQLKK